MEFLESLSDRELDVFDSDKNGRTIVHRAMIDDDLGIMI